MNQFRKHNLFGEGNADNPIIDFTTLDDLMGKANLHLVAAAQTFSHFAMSENSLMAILRDGFDWWVVGYVSDPSALSLPQWDYGKIAVDDDGDRLVVLGRDVESYCGDVVTMKDGRTYRKFRAERPAP